MDKPTSKSDRTCPVECVEPIRVFTTYARNSAIVLERSEFVNQAVTIAELIRAVKRFEDLEVQLVEICLEIPD
jgi:hypothetical protein